MGEVKGERGGGRRELGLVALVALALALWPVRRGVLDPDSVLCAVDTATVQLPWSAALGRGGAGGPPTAARNPELSDQGVVFYPAYRWVAERLAAGELPLWNPWVHAGAPALGNPQLGVLDPQVWFLALLERLGGRALFDRGFAWLAWLRLAAAGLGTWLLARRLGLGRAGASLAALAFAGSGFSVLWLGHSLGHVAPLFPWVLWFIEGVRCEAGRRGALAAAGAAIALALALFGGHPETGCLIGLVAGLRALTFVEPLARRTALAALAAGTGLAAVSIVPFVEYARLSGASAARAALVRPGLDPLGLGALSLAAGAVLWWRRRGAREPRGGFALLAAGLAVAAASAGFPFEALDERAFGEPWSDGFGQGGASAGYLERHSAWLALPVLALAFAALLERPPRRARETAPGYWLAVGFGAWLVASGTPAVEALLRWVPGLGLLAPARAGLVSALALGLAAGCALERARTGARVAGCAVVAAALVLAGRAGPDPLPPGANEALALEGDPVDELATLAVEADAESPAIRAFASLHPALADAVPVVVAERWVGGARFVPGPELALEARLREDGGRLVRAELASRALASGVWRLALHLGGGAGGELGRRVSAPFAVRHAPRVSRRSWGVLALALLGAYAPGGTGWAFFFLATLLQVGLFSAGVHPAVPRSECFPPTRTTDFLARALGHRRYLADRGVLPADTGMAYGLAALDGYDGMDVARFNELRFAALAPGVHPLLDWTPRGVELDSPAFRLFGVGALVCAGPLEHPAWTLAAAPVSAGAPPPDEIERAETWIYLPRDPVPRAFCVPEVVDLEAARADPAGFDPLERAFLRKSVWSPREPFAAADVEVLEWRDERIELAVDLDGDGLLVVTEQHFPGWVAEVDGERRPVLEANAIFRGVPLAAGDRRVTLGYRPGSLRLGLALSGLALLALVWMVRRAAPRRPPAT